MDHGGTQRKAPGSVPEVGDVMSHARWTVPKVAPLSAFWRLGARAAAGDAQRVEGLQAFWLCGSLFLLSTSKSWPWNFKKSYGCLKLEPFSWTFW